MTSDERDETTATTISVESSLVATEETQPGEGGLGAAPVATARVRDPERYHVLAEHGRGGLGRVLRVRDKELARDIAIKELLARTAVSEARFQREALITARLQHPGIVPIYEAGCWPDGSPFYAMKLVSGRSLRELIAAHPSIDERIGLLHHVIAVADAIAYAHNRNIVHRDLKPSNVVVGDFGETVVIDWGLAKDLSEPRQDTTTTHVPNRTAGDALTGTGNVLGTPAYMAPEQERGEQVDQRADVFAIGAMLWELCAQYRVPPSDARERRRMLRRASIDDDLATIIEKAIEPDAAQRYPNAGALADDLKAFKSGARIAARNYSLWAALSHWTRRHRALATLASVFVVVLVSSVVALSVLYRSSQRSAATANAALVDSWVQRGQQEMFAGNYIGALPFLAQAYRSGDHSIAVQAMLHRTLKIVDRRRFTLRHNSGPARFRANGRQVILTGSDGDAIVADAATGEITRRLDPINGKKYSKATISDSGSLAALTRDDSIAVWDGSTVRTLPLPFSIDPNVTSLSFDKDQTHLVLAHDHDIVVWSLAENKIQWSQRIPGFAGGLAVIGDRVAVTGAPNKAGGPGFKIWLVSSQQVSELDTAWDVIPTGADRFLAVSTDHATLYDASGRVVRSFDTPNIYLVAASANGDRLAFGLTSGAIELVDVASGKRLGILTGHTGQLGAIAFSHDGAKLIAAALDHSLRVWDLRASCELFRYLGLDGVPTGIRVSPDDKQVLVTASRETLLFPIDDPAAELIIDAGEAIGAASYVAGGTRIFTTSQTGVELWDARTGAQLTRIATNVLDGAHVNPDLSLVVVPKDDTPDVEVRDLHTGVLHATLHSTSLIAWAIFDHQGHHIATGNREGVVELWTPWGQNIARLNGHRNMIFAIDFSPDDSRLLSASIDGTARLWNVASGKEIGRVQHKEAVYGVRFDSAAREFATGSPDGYATIWDASTMTQIRTFRHVSGLRSIGLSSAMLAGATLSGVVELWDRTSGREIARYQHAGPVQSADFDHDRMLTTAIDGRIVVWDVATTVGSPDEVVAVACSHLYDGASDAAARELLQCPPASAHAL